MWQIRLVCLTVYFVVCLTGFKVPRGIGKLGNSWEFDLGHSQTGIGWEFVIFMQSDWEATKNVSVRKMTSKIIRTF